MHTRQKSESSEAWHSIHEHLNLGDLNPACPYFQLIGQALRFTGELVGFDQFIHPTRHPLARRLLSAPELADIETTFSKWQKEMYLIGARPHAHGSSSVLLEVHQEYVVEFSDIGKQKPPQLPFVVAAEREFEAGSFRMSLKEKCFHSLISEEEIARISRLADRAGYFIEDPFVGNFGRTSKGKVKILDSDAVKPKRK